MSDRHVAAMLRPLLALLVAGGLTTPVHAQAPTYTDPAVSVAAPPERAATVTYANRTIVELRAGGGCRRPTLVRVSQHMVSGTWLPRPTAMEPAENAVAGPGPMACTRMGTAIRVSDATEEER